MNEWMEQNYELDEDGYFESSLLYQYLFVCNFNIDFFFSIHGEVSRYMISFLE